MEYRGPNPPKISSTRKVIIYNCFYPFWESEGVIWGISFSFKQILLSPNNKSLYKYIAWTIKRSDASFTPLINLHQRYFALAIHRDNVTRWSDFVAWTINRWNDIWKVRLIVFVCWLNAWYIADISAISRKNKTQYSTLIVCITLAQYCIYYLMSPIVNFQVQKVKEGFLPKLWGWGTKFLAEWLISTSFSLNVYCSFIQWKTISGEEM